MAVCKHCRDEISGDRKCDTCRRTLKDQCPCCHEELSHGRVPQGTLHFAGGHHAGLTPRQAAKLGKTS